MARPRNDELHKRVTSEIFKELLAHGIAGTSYASVAEACDTSRAIVQAYYPRKSDMVVALNATLNEIAMRATFPWRQALDLEDEQLRKVAHLFLAGSAYFAFMQHDAGRKAFFTELLRDRDQTEQLMFGVMTRSFGEIGRTDVIDDPAYRSDIIMSIGGFYELFYDHLKRGEFFEPTRHFGQMTRVWMHAAGFSRAQFDDVMRQCKTALGSSQDMSEIMERAFAQFLRE